MRIFKGLFIAFFILFTCNILLGQDVPVTIPEADPIYDFLKNLAGGTVWIAWLIMGLGTLSVLGTAIHSVFKIKWIEKVYNWPLVGALLKTLAKFSPLNYNPIPTIKK